MQRLLEVQTPHGQRFRVEFAQPDALDHRWPHNSYNRHSSNLKFLRTNAGPTPGRIDTAEHLAAGVCDVLQLDWDWPETGNSPESFLTEWKKLHKYFFLDQRLRMITNAGAGNVYGCVEALGQYLCEHGDPQVPITAVRGENLLPRIAELVAEGVVFADTLSGKELPVASADLVAAQVHIGAGPIATALDEESRIVVLGCYDAVAPLVASGVSAMNIAWDDYEVLGRLATASVLSNEFEIPVELTTAEQVMLNLSSSSSPSMEQAEQWLRSTEQQGIPTADVNCDVGAIRFEPEEQGRALLCGLAASASDGCWQVRFRFDNPDGKPIERWSKVPRELVNISVDTRPASQWL